MIAKMEKKAKRIEGKKKCVERKEKSQLAFMLE